MKFSTKKRLAIGASALVTVGAVATLIAGVTLGRFSSSAAQGANTFSAGTASLTQTASSTCTVTAMAPGDSSSGYGSGSGTDTPCTFQVTFNGNVPSYVALDVSIASAAVGVPVAPYGGSAPAAAPGLFDGTGTGLQVLIKDNQGTAVTYMTGTTLGGLATPTTGAASATNLLVSKTAFTNNGTVTFTVNYLLPSTATNAYLGAASTITLTAHAVQAANNGSTTTPVACVVGTSCALNGGSWS